MRDRKTREMGDERLKMGGMGEMIGNKMGKIVGQNYVIIINKEGEWFYNGAKIIHPKILRIFNDGLTRDSKGIYYLKVEGDCAEVIVEDAPYVVKKITPALDGDDLVGFVAHLSDETVEVLDLNTVEIDERNVPYCTVKRDEEKERGRLTARFTTTAYYVFANYIEHDEEEDSYFITVKSRRYDIPYSGGADL